MGDCNFGHAKIPLLQESAQGACCDEKHYHDLKPDGVYKSNTPLTIVEGAVPRQYMKLTSSDQEFCGLRTCEIDTTDWEVPCQVSICTKARNLIAQTVCWPDGFTDEDVEILRAQKSCCFEIIAAPCCHDPELPGCEAPAEEAPKEVK